MLPPDWEFTFAVCLPMRPIMFVCLCACPIGLSYICANSKCERKRPGLGRASEMCTILSSYIWLICIFLQYCQGGGLEIASELWVVIWIRRVMNSKRGHISTASRQRLAHRSVQAFTVHPLQGKTSSRQKQTGDERAVNLGQTSRWASQYMQFSFWSWHGNRL